MCFRSSSFIQNLEFLLSICYHHLVILTLELYSSIQSANMDKDNKLTHISIVFIIPRLNFRKATKAKHIKLNNRHILLLFTLTSLFSIYLIFTTWIFSPYRLYYFFDKYNIFFLINKIHEWRFLNIFIGFLNYQSWIICHGKKTKNIFFVYCQSQSKFDF
jgi:hypothetical protein